MAVIRVNKTEKYTVIGNYHFKEKAMSLKAKGLLSLMLSLPDDWDYSINGLVAICKENERAIKSSLEELRAFGYLVITKKMPNETQSGRIEYEYDIYEKPTKKQGVQKQPLEFQPLEFQPLEKQPLENAVQLNTNISNTKELNTKDINNIYIPESDKKLKKHKYGEYKNVLLDDKQLEDLKRQFPDNWQEWIEKLSEGIELKGYKYKNHLLAIKQWAKKDNPKPVQENKEIKRYGGTYL